MKKILSAALALALSAGSVFAFEWGGIFNNNTGFSGSEFSTLKLDQSDNLSLWAKIPLTKSGNQYIAAEASYSFNYDLTENEPLSNYLNLSVLKYSLTHKFGKSNMFNLSAGRFSFIDASTYIFNQTSDGAMISVSTEKSNISLYGSYTGFLNYNITSMLTPETTAFEPKGISLYELSPAYVPAILSVSIPSLFANQHFAAQAMGVFDLNGDNFNRYYATLTLDGKLAKTLAYSVTTVVSSINFQNLSNLSVLNVRFTPSNTIVFKADAVYASGNNGFLSPFTAVTSMKSDLSMSEPEFSGIIKGEGGVTVSILSKVLLNGSAAALFNCETANISYKGFQYSAGAVWNIFNDLQLSANLSQFYGADVFENKTNLSVNLTLAF